MTAFPTAAALTPAHHPELWLQARAQARFKAGLFSYVLVNALLWGLWAVTGRDLTPLPWPVYPTFFWGLGLAARGLRTYGIGGQPSLTEREYGRLLRQRGLQ